MPPPALGLRLRFNDLTRVISAINNLEVNKTKAQSINDASPMEKMRYTSVRRNLVPCWLIAGHNCGLLKQLLDGSVSRQITAACFYTKQFLYASVASNAIDIRLQSDQALLWMV